MKNVDVPLWDKGDSTDSYSKGGGSIFFDLDALSEKIKMIEEVYEKVLGRKPSNRELAQYKYSILKKEEITKRLLNSEEHKEVISKGRNYSELEKREKLAKSTILKLKHGIRDMITEHDSLKNILEEKNKTIDNLRREKTPPYITEVVSQTKYNTYYNTTEENQNEQYLFKKKSFIDKLYTFLKSL